VDGNLITSRCPDDLPAFMAEVIRFLGSGQGDHRERTMVASSAGGR
jgi:hypothetical protein